jgi:hydrogenase maturation protease
LKTLVLGIGNTILGDDGAGVLVVRQAASRIDNPDVCFKETGAAGLNLLDLIIGFDRLIVVDAVLTDELHTGRIFHILPETYNLTGNAISAHSCGLNAALTLAGKMYQTQVPRQVSIIGIGIRQVEIVTESLSPEVEAALPGAIQLLIKEISVSEED